MTDPSNAAMLWISGPVGDSPVVVVNVGGRLPPQVVNSILMRLDLLREFNQTQQDPDPSP